MKALVVSESHELLCQELPEPKPGPYEALVEILGCGICATTDREIIRGRQPFHQDYPCILGHEAIGRVLETGAKVRHFRVGDHVTRPTAIFPGTRRDGLASGWGGFAQRGIVKDRRAMLEDGDRTLEHDYTALRQNVVPMERPLRELILGISLAETRSWLGHVGPIAGRRVCVAGTGIAGLSLALWAKLAGARQVIVIGRRESRLELARAVAADATLLADETDLPGSLRELTGGDGVDMFLEAVGKPDQINVGLSLIRPRGLVAVYGVTEGQRFDLSFSAGPGHGRIAQLPAEEQQAYPWVLEAMARGWVPVDRLMSHEWPLDEWERAFDEVAGGSVVKGFLRIA